MKEEMESTGLQSSSHYKSVRIKFCDIHIEKEPRVSNLSDNFSDSSSLANHHTAGTLKESDASPTSRKGTSQHHDFKSSQFLVDDSCESVSDHNSSDDDQED